MWRERLILLGIKSLIVFVTAIFLCGYGYFMPEKFYFECNGKLMSSSESDNNRDKTIIRNESTLSEIYDIFEMLIFGTKNKAIKVDDSKIITIKSFFFGNKKTIDNYSWSSCSTDEVSITCKADYNSISFNTIQSKLMVDTFEDVGQTKSVQFGIYGCTKASDTLLN